MKLADARLYLCTPVRDAAFCEAVLGAGVDIIQLRDKHATDAELLGAARTFRAAADRHDALFILNDRPDLAVECGADGVHLGQQDMYPADARAIVGDERIVGRSTHSIEELRRARDEPVDYIGVGPVHPTPTKPGRPGVGLGLVEAAAREAGLPWFVTGGMNVRTIAETAAAGARAFVVVRAITEATDPAAATRDIRSAIESTAPGR